MLLLYLTADCLLPTLPFTISDGHGVSLLLCAITLCKTAVKWVLGFLLEVAAFPCNGWELFRAVSAFLGDNI